METQINPTPATGQREAKRSETTLTIQHAPNIVIAEAMRAAQALKDILDKKLKKIIMNGEQYLEFEDWQTLGQFYGRFVKTANTEAVEIDNIKGFKASAVVLNRNGTIVGGAEAYCMRDEPNWNMRAKYEWRTNDKGKRFKTQVGEEQVPSFQLASMAQTRAAAKALRNVLAWVVVLAGYKPTPAEEMITTSAPTPAKTTFLNSWQKNKIISLIKELGLDMSNLLKQKKIEDIDKMEINQAGKIIQDLMNMVNEKKLEKEKDPTDEWKQGNEDINPDKIPL